MEKTLRERIADGECVSPYTTERCPICIDCCEAFHHKVAIAEALENTGVSKAKEDES